MDEDVLTKYLKSGSIASKVREETCLMIKDGVLLLEIAEFTEARIVELGGKLAFPANISIDSQAAHFTPHSKDKLRFKTGNIVKLDLGVHIDGHIADTATTVEVGGSKFSDLIQASTVALDAAIGAVKPGVAVCDIGAKIESTIISKGYKPVSNLSGHLLMPYNLHAGISVPNVYDDAPGILELDMAVAIEPFATDGGGMVVGRKSGNIFRQIREREHPEPVINEAISYLSSEFRGLPFSERAIARRFANSDKLIRKLLRYGVISTYPVLKDAKGGMVSQAEHTVIITDTGCKITTK